MIPNIFYLKKSVFIGLKLSSKLGSCKLNASMDEDKDESFVKWSKDLVFYEVFRIPECSHNHDRLIIYNNLQPVIIDLRCQCQEVFNNVS